MNIVTSEQLLLEDLSKSGLKASDLGAYLAQESELAAVGVKPHLYLDGGTQGPPGYVIPYYDMGGVRAPYYRVKLFHPLPKGAKYLQPQNSGSWLYFPKAFAGLSQLAAQDKGRTKVNGFKAAILITEGEKKAARACIEGFPTGAVGGVYNWRARTIVLPEGTQLVKNRDNQIVARIEGGSRVVPTSDRRAFLAAGLERLIHFVFQHKLQVVIVFDADNPRNPDVEAAAAELAFEFRSHGIPTDSIRQLHLPTDPGRKVGLDDYLSLHGAKSFDSLLQDCLSAKSAFPSHPNLRSLIGKRLNGQMERNEAKELSLMVLADMDRHGVRMVERDTGTPYFFDGRKKTLLRVNLLQHHSEPLHETKFGEYLYKNYDIGQADFKFMQWLAAGFTGEEPVAPVAPRSVLAVLSGNRIAYQVDDGHFAIVSGDPETPLVICENGTEGLLFRADQVVPVDHQKLRSKFREQVRFLEGKPPYSEMFWPHALSQMRFCRDNDAKILATLSYMSPWLLRWNGAQLPVEIVVGEPGSGKSSLYSLRLQILSGRPALRNQPTDVRDWYASITSQDGLHVVDNVHMVNKELRQRLSDEIAQPLDCKVLTRSGWKRMGDIEVGDEVLTPSGEVTKVVEIHPRGLKEVYRIEFTDGSSTESCAGHYWSVRSYYDKEYGNLFKARLLQDIMAAPLKGELPGRYKNYIPMLDGSNIDFRDAFSIEGIPLNPYLLGALLGDGCFRMNQPDFAGTDAYIVERIRSVLPMGNVLRERQPGVYAIGGSTNPTRDALKHLGLWGLGSLDKFVPNAYKWTTCQNRLEVLRGLMDTYGTVHGSGSANFNTMSARLAEDVQFLVQSLGGTASRSQASNGAFTVGVKLSGGVVPFGLPRKADLYSSRKHMSPTRAIRSITSAGTKEVKCITLASREGLYVTDEFIVTHNCRIVTEPDPYVEMRKLFTTSENYRIPARVVFAMTAINQPFMNADILQRALIVELQAIGDKFDSSWADSSLGRFGGRETWLAHHLAVLHMFFRKVAQGAWNPNFKSGHRLAHFEQMFRMIGGIIGVPDIALVGSSLAGTAEAQISNYDWTMEALKEFSFEMLPVIQADPSKIFTLQDVAVWAVSHEEYSTNVVVTSARRLARYVKSHRHMVEKVAGIVDARRQGNRDGYRLVPVKAL